MFRHRFHGLESVGALGNDLDARLFLEVLAKDASREIFIVGYNGFHVCFTFMIASRGPPMSRDKRRRSLPLRDARRFRSVLRAADARSQARYRCGSPAPLDHKDFRL